MTGCVNVHNTTMSFIFSCWASWSTENTPEIGYDIDKFCCKGTRQCHNRRNIPGTGSSTSGWLPTKIFRILRDPKFHYLIHKRLTGALSDISKHRTFLRWGVVSTSPKLENNLLSVVRDCLFNIFAATLRICRSFLHPPS